MNKKLLTIISAAALTGIISTSAVILHAKTNNSENTAAESKTEDYEALLAPYQTLLDEFNKTHGTTYGFVSDEQLKAQNMDREKYLKDMADTYSIMTAEEFNERLEVTANHHQPSPKEKKRGIITPKGYNLKELRKWQRSSK